jgi:hypothetical protein
VVQLAVVGLEMRGLTAGVDVVRERMIRPLVVGRAAPGFGRKLLIDAQTCPM